MTWNLCKNCAAFGCGLGTGSRNGPSGASRLRQPRSVQPHISFSTFLKSPQQFQATHHLKEPFSFILFHLKWIKLNVKLNFKVNFNQFQSKMYRIPSFLRFAPLRPRVPQSPGAAPDNFGLENSKAFWRDSFSDRNNYINLKKFSKNFYEILRNFNEIVMKSFRINESFAETQTLWASGKASQGLEGLLEAAPEGHRQASTSREEGETKYFKEC